MKNFVITKFCKTPEECAYAIEEFRLSLTPQKCQNYISKIDEVFIIYLNINNKKIIFNL